MKIFEVTSTIEMFDEDDYSSLPSYLLRYFDNPEYFNREKNIFIHKILMTPDDYISMAERALSRAWGNETPKHSRQLTGKQNIDRLVDLAKSGVKFPMPFISVSDNLQDGLHRAEAAKSLGIPKIPVLVVDDRGPKIKKFSESLDSGRFVTVFHGNNYGTKRIEVSHMDNSINEYGVGIYFTDNLETAKTYGKDVVSATIDKRKFIDSTSSVSKLGSSFVRLLKDLFKRNTEGVWYYMTDYGIEAQTPEDITEYDFHKVAKMAKEEQIRHAQQTLTDYTTVEDFVSSWNSIIKLDGLRSHMQTGETFYVVINPSVKIKRNTL